LTFRALKHRFAFAELMTGRMRQRRTAARGGNYGPDSTIHQRQKRGKPIPLAASRA
jgi:hypothetical protein